MDAAAGMGQPVGFPADDSPDVHLGYWMICAARAGPEQDAEEQVQHDVQRREVGAQSGPEQPACHGVSLCTM